MFFPLAPGIESIWEPFQEEVEARVQEVQQQFDDVLDGMHLYNVYLPCCITFTGSARQQEMHTLLMCSSIAQTMIVEAVIWGLRC